jgi:hypothetical protein
LGYQPEIKWLQRREGLWGWQDIWNGKASPPPHKIWHFLSENRKFLTETVPLKYPFPRFSRNDYLQVFEIVNREKVVDLGTDFADWQACLQVLFTPLPAMLKGQWDSENRITVIEGKKWK